MQSVASTREEIRTRAIEIERQVDEGRYRPGPWEALLEAARGLPRVERGSLAEDFSRISQKLHLRGGRRTLPVGPALVLEGLAALVGASFLVLAVQRESNLFGILAALVWIASFQPLLKVSVGYLVGIDYDYAYLYGMEPRFKMRYGEYLASPRWARITLHVAGMVGSPLGAYLVAICLGGTTWVARLACWIIFWLTVAINLVSLGAGLAGVRRLGKLKLSLSSGGVAGQELREALEI